MSPPHSLDRVKNLSMNNKIFISEFFKETHLERATLWLSIFVFLDCT